MKSKKPPSQNSSTVGRDVNPTTKIRNKSKKPWYKKIFYPLILVGAIGGGGTALHNNLAPYLSNQVLQTQNIENDRTKKFQLYQQKINKLNLGTSDGALKKLNLGIEFKIYTENYEEIIEIKNFILGMKSLLRYHYEDNTDEVKKKFLNFKSSLEKRINKLKDENAKEDLIRLLRIWYHIILSK